jgi:hypothetical protein
MNSKRPLESPSQSSSQSSLSPSEEWLNSVPKAQKLSDSFSNESDNDDNDDKDDNDPDLFPPDDESGPSPESTLVPLIEGESFTYSRTSDHKPVYMKFYLEGIPESIVALTYNMSFASDLGIATGSEKNFVQRAIDENPDNTRAYWENAAKLVLDFVKTQNPTIMYFQEMNDQLKIREKNSAFDGGYQALLELLATGTVSYSDTQKSYRSRSGSPLISYYTQGTYSGNNSTNYGFLAYSIQKIESYGTIYPTVLTIWNRTILGDFANFYGNDLGLHPKYKGNPFHYGRNFSCVKTSNGANLINLHGPNDPFSVKTKLKPAIEDYMTEAATKFTTWNAALTVIGGDTNDIKDSMKTIKYGATFYKYRGNAPKSCCAEYFDFRPRDDTLNKDYVYSGDKFLVKKFNFDTDPDFYLNNPLFNKNILYKPSNPRVIYGGRTHSRNLKKKKSLKKRKTIKKRYYKLKNKKSFKKRRIFRRKTRKHTHINNNVIL